MFRDASCFKRDIHNDASVTQIVPARWGETVVDLPRLLGETNQARELASAGPIRCAGLRYPAGLIRPADAGLIGCAGLRCPAGLIWRLSMRRRDSGKIRT